MKFDHWPHSRGTEGTGTISLGEVFSSWELTDAKKLGPLLLSAVLVAVALSYGIYRATSESPLISRGPSLESERFKTWSDLGDHYSFVKVQYAFDPGLDLERASEVEREDLEEMILLALPAAHLRRRLKPYLPIALDLAQKYQVDPFWVLAVMWTESHFDQRAKSPVNARGLMQIMPGTARYLSSLMMVGDASLKEAIKLSQHPMINMEMGVFYLSRLLKAFKHNYVLATVAYNMGPGWVSQRLRNGGPVGVRNYYLNKVRRHYLLVSRRYRRLFRGRKKAYLETLVVKDSAKPQSLGPFHRLKHFTGQLALITQNRQSKVLF